MTAHELSLAVSTSGAFAAWHGGERGRSSIYLQPLDARGQPSGTAVRVSDGSGLAFEPDVVWRNDQLAVAWYERARGRSALSAWLAGVDTGGTQQWIVRLGADDKQVRNPVVRFDGETLHVAWIEQDGADSLEAAILYQRFSPTGTPMTPSVQVGQASHETWNLNAALHEGDFVIVYDARLGTQAHELHMIAVGQGGARYRQLSEDDGHASLYPDLQISPSGRAALTWFDERDGNREVYLHTGEAEQISATGTSTALRVSHTFEDSIGAYLAWNGEVIGLAWSDRIGGRRDIFIRQFTADGRPVGPLYRVGSTAEHAGVPAIRGHDDGFLIAWNDYVLRGDAAHMDVVSSRARFAQVPVKP